MRDNKENEKSPNIELFNTMVGKENESDIWIEGI